MDSLGVLELRNSIAEAFVVDLPATAALDFPSIAALAMHILLLKQPLCAAHAQLAVPHSASKTDTPCCAFLGAGCIFPGSSFQEGAFKPPTCLREVQLKQGSVFPKKPDGYECTGIPAFWHHLQQSESVQTDVPLQRWDSDAHHDPAGALGKAYVRAAAFCQAEATMLG